MAYFISRITRRLSSDGEEEIRRVEDYSSADGESFTLVRIRYAVLEYGHPDPVGWYDSEDEAAEVSLAIGWRPYGLAGYEAWATNDEGKTLPWKLNRNEIDEKLLQTKS